MTQCVMLGILIRPTASLERKIESRGLLKESIYYFRVNSLGNGAIESCSLTLRSIQTQIRSASRGA